MANKANSGNAAQTDSTQAQTGPTQEFGIQRVYVKDLSFEAPGSPAIFRTQWQPDVHLDLNTAHQKLEDGVYEIVLTVTTTVKSAGTDNTVFLLEVKQAGIFTAKNFPQDHLSHLLNSYGPSVLFPYAREVISDVATRGSFPQLIIAPINFDMLYEQHLAKKTADQNSSQPNS